jgi:hypothetical protein
MRTGTAPLTRWPSGRLLSAVAGVTGILALFLPFTAGYSPMSAVRDGDLWHLAFPFFISILIAAASARWILFGRFSRSEQMVAYVLSTATACVMLSLYAVYVTDDSWPAGFQEWLSAVFPLVILALGAAIVIRNLRTGRGREFNPVIALQVAYLAHSVLCLVSFFGNWQVGAVSVLITACAYSLQIILISAQQGPPRATLPETPYGGFSEAD